MMTKKLIVTMLLVLMASSPMVFGDEEGGLLGEWKQNLASPTYGIALTAIEIQSCDEDGYSETIWLPGIDLRLFRGVNVAKRGGFFAGVEVGTLFFFTPEDAASFEDSIPNETPPGGTTDYTVEMNLVMANVFLLAKYGYRLDLGIALGGISVGWEMGIGACIAQGGGDLKTQIGDDYGSNSFGSESIGLGVMLDTALEAAIRLGKNFRIFARLGAMVTPPIFMGSGDAGPFWNSLDNGYVDGEADALITRYDI
jgi:hypothetical protein